MGRPMTVSQSVVIAAPPDVVFASISDPTQTGRWSPENLGARVQGPLTVGSIASWSYDLTPVDGGTEVVETWHDGRRSWSDRIARIFDKVATGSTFAEFNTRNIRRTLDQLKQALETAA